MATGLNELANTAPILSIDGKTSSGKVAFNFVKGCKNKDYWIPTTLRIRIS
jgi:hypothetical protein